MAAGSEQLSAGAENERRNVASTFEIHIDIASKVMAQDPEQRDTLTGESFEVAQLVRATSVGAAISRMAARFAAGDDTLAGVVRARQDKLRDWRHLDEELVNAAGKPPGERDMEKESRWRTEKEGLTARLEELDGSLAQEFPEYAELTSPQPMSLAAVQALLGPDEALIAYMTDDDRTHLWALRADRAKQFVVEGVGRVRLERYVTLIRKALDPGIGGGLPDFDTAEAFELYRAVFAPAEPLLEGVRHVMVVPDGALQSLPLGVLVTSLPENGVSDYLKVDWLAKQFAITTLPTVSSLRALRKFAKATKASDPFTGFGDPSLAGSEGNARGFEAASLFRGTIANVNEVRKLRSLPGAAAELKKIADHLGGKEKDLYLRDRATETRVKEIALDQSKVVAFATHGLISGQFRGLSEPALVLTPPAKATEADDGLLTASEIAQLKLDADLVILSACNTASAEKPGAEGLSGLAKAFFYAGARSLLVSHWPVETNAAAKLTTGMFDALKADPGIGRSEALRRSMMALRANDDNPLFAHPLLWAPFVVVGEGGAQR
jgi:CHAT domain-containing protein